MRMETIRENLNKRSHDEKLPPAFLTLREKLLIFGSIGGVLFLMVAVKVVASSINDRKAIQQRVDGWKSKHSLTDSQAADLLKIELDFHGHGGLFSMDYVPTPVESDAHRRAIESKLAHHSVDH